MSKTETIGNRLQEVRLKNNLTAEQLSQIVNIPVSTLGSYERGTRQPPIELLQFYIEHFRIDGTWLITGKDIHPKEINIDLTKVKGLTIKF